MEDFEFIPLHLKSQSTGTKREELPAHSFHESLDPETLLMDEQVASDIMSRRESIIEKLKTVFDPEIPVDIWELGLIYEININGDRVDVVMTLTTPNCPVAGSLPGVVEQAVLSADWVKTVKVELTFEPSWNKDMMSESAQLELGFW